MTSIEFGGLVFDDQAEAGFTISSWAGWWDAAPPRVRLNGRPQADGAFGIANVWKGARVVSVEGSWVGSSMEDAYSAMRALVAMQPGGVPSRFRVVEPFSALSAEVVIASGPTLPQELFSPFFRFSFDVVAVDPLKYGDEVTTGTGLPSEGGGLIFDAPSGLDPLVGVLTYPGEETYPSESLFPGGFE